MVRRRAENGSYYHEPPYQSDLPLEHARSGVMSACYHFATQLDSTRQNWAGQRDRLRREKSAIIGRLGTRYDGLIQPRRSFTSLNWIADLFCRKAVRIIS